MDYFYIDIETLPLDKEAYLAATEEGRKKLMNPIDSRAIAIGVQKNAEPARILYGPDETKLLQDFWSLLAQREPKNSAFKIVGFNIKDFDLPFLVTRSFLMNVKILPFLLKEVVDVREQMSAFKFGNTRGKLKEFGSLMGLTILDDIDGSLVAETYWAGEHDKIQLYLRKDLEITQAMHARMIELRIAEIGRW